tara:strand:- start:5736 stop:8120 length:2385 start_codon:yes stop_codon:yes gene_type:complete
MWTFHGGTVVLTCCVIVLIHFFFSNCNIFCTKFDSKLCRRIGENHNNLQSRNQRLINFASEEVKSYRSFHDFPYSLNYVNSLRFYVLNDSDSGDLADGMLSVKQRFHEYFVSDSGKDFQDAIKLLFVQSPLDKKVRRRIKVIVSDANLVTIYFSERIEAFLALGRLMVAAKNAPFGLVKSKQALIAAGMEFDINVTVEELGFKLDTSSRGVPAVERLQDLTISLSLYGYRTLFIYMEDTFVVENEPFFGYMQKRFTYEDFVALGKTAKSVGIEIIPSILLIDDIKSLIKWPIYSSILQAPPNNEEKYDLFHRVILAVSEPLESKRIHINVGEKTHEYFVQKVYAKCSKYLGNMQIDRECFNSEIQSYSAHLKRVVDISRSLNIVPAFYTDSIEICPKEQSINRVKFPEDCNVDVDTETFIQLNEALGDSEIEFIHRNYASEESAFDKKIKLLGSLVDDDTFLKQKRNWSICLSLWSWNRFWVALYWSVNMMESGFTAALKNNIKHVYITAWSHDGSEILMASIEAALAFFSELVHTKNEQSSRSDVMQRVDESFKVLFRRPASFSDMLVACALDQPSEFPVGWGITNLAKWLTWEDPLTAHLNPQLAETNLITHYRILTDNLDTKISQFLRQLRMQGSEFDGIEYHPLSFPAALARFLHRKLTFYRIFSIAYSNNDKKQMARLIGRRVDGTKLSEVSVLEDLLLCLSSLHSLHHKIWMLEFDPLGWAQIESRYGVLKIRLESTRKLIFSYLQDESAAVRELKSYFFQKAKIHTVEVFALPLFTWSQAAFLGPTE